jgi:hypothetical protein
MAWNTSARARIAVACRGPRCPRLRPAGANAGAALGRLRRELQGRVFTAADRLELTVMETGLTPERIEFRIREGAAPVAKPQR